MWKAMLAMTQVTQGVHTSPAFRLSVHPAELGIGQACRTYTNIVFWIRIRMDPDSSMIKKIKLSAAEIKFETAAAKSTVNK